LSSIRVFLVVVILAAITLFSFLAALRGYQSSMLEAERLFDKQLLDTARLIANIHTDRDASNINHDSALAFQVWQGNQLKAYSSNAPDKPLSALESGFGYSNFDGFRWRTIAYYDPATRYWVLAAERTDLRYMLAENVILNAIYPILLGLPIIGLLIWLIVSHGLRPLRELADMLGSKQPEDLSPLVIDSPRLELSKIISSSNGLLQRLETSLQRERQFASDAAHELRTPISILKVQLYNLEQSLDGVQLDELQATAARLAHIVEQILALYRSSPDQYNATFVPIDLAALAQEVMAENFTNFEDKQQSLEFHGERAQIMGDRFALLTLLQNLLSNANKYTPRGGRIEVNISQGPADSNGLPGSSANGTRSAAPGREVLLSIEDSGPGISEDQRAAIFDRFYRIGADRHQSGESGCGLGLAIVQRIVDLHHAVIEVGVSTKLKGASFRIRFPAMARAGGVPQYSAEKLAMAAGPGR